LSAPLFPRWSDSILRAALVAGVLVAGGCPVALMAAVRTEWLTGERRPIEQPVAFDHRHHVRDDAVDCHYCHVWVEESAWAGIPPTALCLGCHAQVWNDSPELAPVFASAASGLPLRWKRVHDLADFVYFDHAAHVDRGVGCETCHGRVDLMARVYQVAPLTMGWCLDCHRDPAPHLRPADTITAMGRPEDPVEGARIAAALGIDAPTDCYGCHR
jgi:hypothetical protein